MKILMVDDHDLVRAGVRLLLLELDEALHVVEAASCDAALASLDHQRFDLILLDFHLPGVHGLPALRQLQERSGATPIVLLSAEANPGLIRKTLDEGAAGFISKSVSADEMIDAIRRALAGGRDPAAAVRAPDRLAGAVPRSFDELTPRQVETLRLAMQGKANKVIAREMGISDATVKAHLACAFRALGVRNRTEAMFAVARTGMAVWAQAPAPAAA